MELRANTGEIFWFKWFIGKIFQNKGLSWNHRAEPKTKGAGHPRPFQLYNSVISISSCRADNLHGFIFFVESAAYREKRQNRDLTKFFDGAETEGGSGPRLSTISF